MICDWNARRAKPRFDFGKFDARPRAVARIQRETALIRFPAKAADANTKEPGGLRESPEFRPERVFRVHYAAYKTTVNVTGPVRK